MTIFRRLPILILALVAVGCAASPATPAPTPEIIVKTVTVEIPAPQPTPLTIEKRVEHTPQACATTIDDLITIVLAQDDVIQRFANDKLPTDAQLAAHTEAWASADMDALNSCVDSIGIQLEGLPQ